MMWMFSRPFARFAVVLSAIRIALAIFNLMFNTSRVASWLPLLVMMPLLLVYNARILRMTRTNAGGGSVLTWPEPTLQGGESVTLQTRASWAKSGLARGGTLILTDRRLIFEPNSVEAAIGLTVSDWPVDAINQIGIAPRGWNPFSGAIRRRLRISFIDGTTALFVVDEVDDFAGRLVEELA